MTIPVAHVIGTKMYIVLSCLLATSFQICPISENVSVFKVTVKICQDVQQKKCREKYHFGFQIGRKSQYISDNFFIVSLLDGKDLQDGETEYTNGRLIWGFLSKFREQLFFSSKLWPIRNDLMVFSTINKGQNKLRKEKRDFFLKYILD